MNKFNNTNNQRVYNRFNGRYIDKPSNNRFSPPQNIQKSKNKYDVLRDLNIL